MKKSWLNGKTVIISGASGGIGFAVTELLIKKYGCKVYGIARNKEKIEKAAQSLGEYRKNFSYELFDVSDKNKWVEFSAKLESANVSPDVLINNAGFMLPFTKFENVSEKDIDEIIATDFASYVYAVKTMLPLIRKSKSPAILNVASAAGNCAVVGESMYCATKFAVKGFTETLIQEYKKEIYIGGIYPGFIKTDIVSRMDLSDKNMHTIEKMMMPLNKAAKKIVKGIARRKKRIILGFDGRYMSLCGRLFPSSTPSIITAVLKKSGLDMFSGVFGKKDKK